MSDGNHHPLRLGLLIPAFCILSGLVWFMLADVPNAAAANQSDPLTLYTSTGQAENTTQTSDDTACRLCHSETTSVITFPSGETLSVQINLAELDTSVHSQHSDADLACTSCHAPNQYQYPHQPVEAPDLLSYQLTQAQATCERCHQDTHLTSHEGIEGDPVANCVSCHSAHNVQAKETWSEGIGVETCVACHESNEVGVRGRAELIQVIQNGLFTTTAPTNTYCASCHSLENLALTLPSEEILDLTVTADTLAHSVHGEGNEWQPLDCVDCHEDYRFPHEPITAENLRAYSLEKYPACGECHQPKYDQAQDSVHAAALEEGKLEAAMCTDCHGAHDTPPPAEPRERISQTCRQCHSTIFDEYAASVHGEALISEGNEDVPTCINCHGVHNINDPTTAQFRVRSPELCASCHADNELMNKYEISTDVFTTYVSDFHGTTVTLFEHQDPTVETNKAVCYDCHGVHNIKEPDDPDAGIKNNLLVTCQQCHPDASENFPNAWTSHFRPSLQNNSLVYMVNSFYWLVIPGTLAFFGFLVLTDIYRRVIRRR
ncbi:MAG: cytochrome c3 family protein [Chloroflexi bacterium]|nr:cytochrome c3 family protein [Chloroflexota bacterium]MBP8056800.1 cytochrome c3 family protein [Chloroflexota bacterium]